MQTPKRKIVGEKSNHTIFGKNWQKSGKNRATMEKM
jgi:hypothetical protein